MPFSVNLDQWADGPAPDMSGDESWVNGNLNKTKAHYNEGDAIPYRATIDDLEDGKTYTITIEYDTVDSGAYAIDYLTGYNYSFDGFRHLAEPDVDPLLGISGLSDATEDVYTAPLLYSSQLSTGFGGAYGSTEGLTSDEYASGEFIKLFTNSGDSVTNFVILDDGSGEQVTYSADGSKASITVSFTYHDDDSIAGNNQVVLAWGGHIASSLDWKDDPTSTVETAFDINGSPYHMRVTGATIDGEFVSVGNQDRSLSANAVVAAPVAEVVQILADEDDIPVVGNNDSAAGDDDQSGLTGDLNTVVSDDTIQVEFGVTTGDDVLVTLGSVPVRSDGTALEYYLIDGAVQTLYATTNAAGTDADALAGAAFVMTLDKSSFLYTFQMLSRVDHDATATDLEDNIGIIDISYLASGPGGTTENFFEVTLDDDSPVAPTVGLSGDDPISITFDGGLSGNYLGTESLDDTNASRTVSVVDFSDAFSIGNPGDYGADGAGSTTESYVLQLDSASYTEGDPSGLTTGGTAIRLYINDAGTLVTGSTAATEGAVDGTNTAFTLAIDTTTGIVTQTQSKVIDNPTGQPYSGSYIEDDAALADNLVEIVASASTTDNDGDTTGDITATYDLGQNILFGDDGPVAPTVGLSGDDPISITFDGGLSGNYLGTESPDDTNASRTVSVVDFSDAFSIGNPGDYGADGAGSTTESYVLQLDSASYTEGDPSGLTTGGTAIRLYINDAGTLVTGSTAATEGAVDGTNTAFTLAIDTTTGIVTQTQSKVIDNPTGQPYSGSYIEDDAALADNLVEIVASASTTDNDGDTTGDITATYDLGQNILFGDDGPDIEVENLVGAGTTDTQSSRWSLDSGADGFGSLGLTIDGYSIGTTSGSLSKVSLTGPTTSGTDPNIAYTFNVQINDDFNQDATVDPDEIFEFDITFNPDGTYDVVIAADFGSEITASSADGQLDAGGPDPVRTLTLDTNKDGVFTADDKDVVFFGVGAETSLTNIVSAVQLGVLDLTEAQVEGGGFAFLGTADMNVSTAGIGIGNNNLNGSGSKSVASGDDIDANDESFIVNPEGDDLVKAKVFIDNAVAGYKTSQESLYYEIIYFDGTSSGPIRVDQGDLTPESGKQVSFLIEDGGTAFDAFQLTMGSGTIKIPVIDFTFSSEFIVDPVYIDLTATTDDGEGPTADDASSSFSIAIETDDDIATDPGFDFVDTEVRLSELDDQADVFNFKFDEEGVTAAEASWEVTGFDSGVDLLIISGAIIGAEDINFDGTDTTITETVDSIVRTITVLDEEVFLTDIDSIA